MQQGTRCESAGSHSSVVKIGKQRSVEGFSRKIQIWLGLTFLLCTSPSTGVGSPQNSNANWISGAPADTFWNKLEQSPYAQDGDRGLVIYMLSYSSCGNCIAFLRDFWQARRGNMRLREIFVPINQPQFINEAADIALTRSAALADSYYHRAHIAPPANNSPERQAALQRAVAITTDANTFFRKIGHIQDGYPTFVFRVHDGGEDKLWVVSGFGPEFAKALDGWIKKALQ